ncbi:metallophosphoesterase [Methanolobus sp. WCC5]|jgi:putative phosphoesterase|uniref:metallophosphoesterase n=1 Tax=Methanolobus sp. WCC5 TaxID=3125785 RepID=UPI00324F5EE1
MIGIMADSHDSMDAIRAAVELFNMKKVSIVLHAGDIISPFTAAAFSKLDAKMYFVFGNNDGDRLLLKQRFEEIGAQCCGDFADLELNGKRIALLHGIYEPPVNALAESGDFDIVVRGHTHHAGVTEVNETLVINPGETAGVLTGKRTVALLDPELGVQIIEI